MDQSIRLEILDICVRLCVHIDVHINARFSCYMHKANDANLDNMKPLEEKLEFSNVTNARQDFLPLMERLQKNPALRVLILKHGVPQAVLMSHPTYDALKKLSELAVQSTDALSRSQRVEAAVDRLTAERSASPQSRAAVMSLHSQMRSAKTLLEQLQAALRESEDKIRTLDTVLDLDVVERYATNAVPSRDQQKGKVAG